MLKQLLSVSLLALLLTSLTACESLQQMQAEMEAQQLAAKQANLAKLCNYDGAFEQGNNDAASGAKMQGSTLAADCPADVRQAVMKGYREGYASAPRPTPVPVTTTPIVVVTQPQAMPRTCIESYGRKTCGYHCKEAYGKVKCAQIPGNVCVEAYGDIRCGRNCRTEYGSIKCDQME